MFLTLLESTVYVPYPAGGLCIRDERNRFLTTWTSPFINVNQENDIAMGIYGVEGRFVLNLLPFMITAVFLELDTPRGILMKV